MLRILKNTSTRMGTLGVWSLIAVLLAGLGALLMRTGGSPILQAAAPIQIHLDHWANGGTVKSAHEWIDGNLHWTNSTYREGDSVPTRFVVENLTNGTTHTIQFAYLTTKNQAQVVNHAHDYVTTFDADIFKENVNPAMSTALTAYPDPCDPLVQGGGKVPAGCAVGSAPTSSLAITADQYVSGSYGFSDSQSLDKKYKIWNATFTGQTDAQIVFGPNPLDTCNSNNNSCGKTGGYTNTTRTARSVSFTVACPGGAATCNVILAMGGHLSNDGDWAPKNLENGAANINGAPYHWEYYLYGVSTGGGTVLEARGNRDRSIMIMKTGSVNVTKVCQPDVDDESLTFPFTFTESPDLGDGGFPVSKDLHCGETFGPTIVGGPTTITVTEGTLPAGWVSGAISCSLGTQTVTGSNKSVTINFQVGDNWQCTFTNLQPDLRISLSPASAFNEIGKPHTITATVQQNKQDGNGWVAAVGAKVDFTYTNSGTNVSPLTGTCTTGAAGACTVQITSTTPGTVTISATTTFSVLGVSLTRETGDGKSGDGSDVTKTYVDAYIILTPGSATNNVGEPHTITAHVQQNEGGGAGYVAAPNGTKVDFTYTNSGTNVSPATGTCTISNGLGTCTVQIVSSSPGTVTIHATTTFSVKGVSLTRATGDGISLDGPNVTKVYQENLRLEATKVCTGNVAPGADIYFTGTIHNRGDVPLNNIALNDTLPSGASGLTITTAPKTTLAVDETTNYAGHYLPPQTPGAKVNSVTPTGKSVFTGEAVAAAKASDQGCAIDTTPAISVTKICSFNSALSRIDFSGVIKNIGNVTLNSITVVDNQPAANTPVQTPGAATLAPNATTNYSGFYPIVSAGSYTDTITVTGKDAIYSTTVTANASCTAIVPGTGRWTGGGSNFGAIVPPNGEDIRVTKGMELHCAPAKLPNNLEINWGPKQSNNFHLVALDAVLCTDDLAIDPAHPRASFDTITGTGHGTLNNKPGATVSFEFKDAGEPQGSNDTLTFTVKDSGGTVVLQMPVSKLTYGNMQAH